MQFKPSLIGEAASIAGEHDALLVRLPATLQAFILVELQKWATLFEPERKYQKTLLAHLAALEASDLKHATAGIARVESDAGCDKIARGDPARFQEESQALLRKQRLLQRWRQEVDAFFQRINPELEARLHPADRPRRLVVQLYGSGVAIQAGNMWSRFKGTGIRIPLALDGAQGSGAFLGALAPGLIAPAKGSSDPNPFDAWLIEANESLNELVGTSLTGLSYDRLRGYREELTRALYQKIQSGVESPQAFASYARNLKIAPGSDVLLRSPEQLQAFVRDVFLTGNGTLFVNNTFVEWAAVQALRRAQPRLLVTRYGVRDKLKPFSSLLLFSQPRATDQIPLIEDPVGSFVDVEQLSYYVWLNAEKNAAYRGKTLFLFLAEGFEEMLAIRSDTAGTGERRVAPVTLADVCATMARWLGAPLPESSGTAIAPLIT